MPLNNALIAEYPSLLSLRILPVRQDSAANRDLESDSVSGEEQEDGL
jgi:hypothetical protein